MPEEAAPFAAVLDSPESVAAPGSLTAVRGTLDGTDALVITTGIGLVAAASAATWAIVTHAPAALISAGTCGGLASNTEVGDIAVAETSTYGTADATEFGYERGQVPGQPVRFHAATNLVAAARAAAASEATWHIGRILSGDTFVTARTVDEMRSAFPDAVATDMETCAIAQVCTSLDAPFISVRGISDLCGPQAGQEFHIGVDEAANHSRDAVVQLLAQLP